MIAVITGGTSGIGLAIAKILNQRQYEIYIIGSREEFSLEEFSNAHYFRCNLADNNEVDRLLEAFKDINVDIFIDNAGFGDIGTFLETSDQKEMQMIDVNIKAMHRTLKYFVNKMYVQGYGRILVTSSLAAFSSSGYMNTYYATKVYSLHLALGYRRELKDKKSPVTISVLCPGPVATGFEKTANVKFNIKPVSKEKVAKVAVKKMFKGKAIIIPTLKFKLSAFMSHFSSKLLSNYIVSKTARKRRNE